MAYVATQKDNIEVIFSRKPHREKIDGKLNGKWTDAQYRYGHCLYRETTKITLPKGSIEKLIGKKLCWSDEPVKIA